jgi:hypothetical protein
MENQSKQTCHKKKKLVQLLVYIRSNEDSINSTMTIYHYGNSKSNSRRSN